VSGTAESSRDHHGSRVACVSGRLDHRAVGTGHCRATAVATSKRTHDWRLRGVLPPRPNRSRGARRSGVGRGRGAARSAGPRAGECDRRGRRGIRAGAPGPAGRPVSRGRGALAAGAARGATGRRDRARPSPPRRPGSAAGGDARSAHGRGHSPPAAGDRTVARRCPRRLRAAAARGRARRSVGCGREPARDRSRSTPPGEPTSMWPWKSSRWRRSGAARPSRFVTRAPSLAWRAPADDSCR
jgi:hypothetical protein